MEGNNSTQDEIELRRGPWTVEEDLTLINYIATHGEGRWNSLARSAGLKRTGKSCRLRWLNYLRPDVRRGNITLEEQLLILELHSRWGNRWSKIAQYLPGRTDNEIKNYWRTRVQKHAKQLKCDVNSKQFKDTMRYLWMPRLVERIQAASGGGAATSPTTGATVSGPPIGYSNMNMNTSSASLTHAPVNSKFSPENSANSSSESFGTDLTEYYSLQANSHDVKMDFQVGNYQGDNNCDYNLSSQGMDYQDGGNNYMERNSQWFVGDTSDNLWNVEDFLVFQQQLNSNM